MEGMPEQKLPQCVKGVGVKEMFYLGETNDCISSVGSGWVEIQFVAINISPFGPFSCAPKCHKTVISDHRWLQWLQLAGSQWILDGSGWDTSRMVHWGHLDPLELPPGASKGDRNQQKMP